MNTITDSTSLQTWLGAYAEAGFKLIPIPAGQKSPRHKGWQLLENCQVPPTWDGNLGLALAYCDPPLMTLDIDWYQAAYLYLQELNVDLVALLNAPDAVRISSGREGHYKLVYRLPAWTGPVARKQVSQDGQAIIDFRCATRGGATVQDVLPPSIHPDTGQPYVWEGDFRNIPEIPAELFQIWLGLLERAPTVRSSTGVRDNTEEELRSALLTLDPDMDRDSWVKVGMALHSADPTADWLFDEWSATGDKYVGDDVGPVWESFEVTAGGITVGTLFRMALDLGWKNPGPSVQEMLNLPDPEPIPKSLGSAAVRAECATEPLLGELIEDPLALLMRDIQGLHPWSMGDPAKVQAARGMVARGLAMDKAAQAEIKHAIKDVTTWNSPTYDGIYAELKRARRELMGGGRSTEQVFAECIYIASMGRFLHKESGQGYTAEGFSKLFYHLGEEVQQEALNTGGCTKVTAVDFDPSQPEFFHREGVDWYNAWTGLARTGTPGDPGPWIEHLQLLVPNTVEREHLLNWMAFTLQQPGRKINHAFVWGGAQGIGKDMLLRPLIHALGRHGIEVEGRELEREFNSYLCEAKLIIFQEVEYEGHNEARKIANRIKSLAAAPPDTLSVNRKGLGEYNIRNVASVALTTNSRIHLEVVPGDRRYFMVYSELVVIGANEKPLPGWDQFFKSFWAWLEGGGSNAVINYLLSRNVSTFNPGARPPLTGAKLEAIAGSRTPLQALLNDMIEGQLGPFAADVTTSDIVRRYLSTNDGVILLSKYGVKEVPSAVVLGRELRAQPLTHGSRVMFRGCRLRVMWRGPEQEYAGGVAAYLDTHPATCNLVPWR